MDGTILDVLGGRAVRFERWLDHPLHTVWAAITEPEQISAWLAPAEVELRVGGRIAFHFENSDHVMTGTITAADPPWLLEYTWSSPDAPTSRVRWELAYKDGRCRLTLTHTVEPPAGLVNLLAGWHIHLDLLAQSLAGEPSSWPMDRFRQVRGEYRAAFPDAPSFGQLS